MALSKGIAEQAGMEHPVLDGVRQHTGSFDAAPYWFGLVISRFNTDLTQALCANAVTVLKELGARPENIEVVWVPGAFEIPTALELLAQSERHHALIALGAVVQGATPHAQAINREVSHALVSIARTYRVPVIDGVVVADSIELAAERCLGDDHNRGRYAARAAVEMANLIHHMKAL